MAAVLMAVFRGSCRLYVLLTAALSAVHYVGAAVEIYAPHKLFIENGTYAKLNCTFKSSEVTGRMTSVSWSYAKEGSHSLGIAIFHYIDGRQVPGSEPRFKDRITWEGDINNRDASIKIDKITFKDNGNYICYVVNPPDKRGDPMRIKLQVVEKDFFFQVPVDVSVPDELLVENGMQATLPCTFDSREPTSSATAVMWMYTREGPDSPCMVIFYYIGGMQYPGSQPQFSGRVTWAGDIDQRIVSIKIDKTSPEDNGSYSCTVINPPDISSPKHIKLRVAG